MKKAILMALAILLAAIPVTAADGIIHVSSDFTVRDTAGRLERILKEKGVVVFNRVKHSESAAHVGIVLRNTELN